MSNDKPEGKLAKWKLESRKERKARQAIRKGYECDTHIVVLSLFFHRSPSPE
jgi:hypothetical protein